MTKWFVLFLVLAISGLCLAQSESATLSGRVSDSTGAAIVGAEVVLTNTQTNVEQRTKTNGVGLYVFSGVHPGTYRVAAGATGFRVLIKEGLTLHVQDELAENFSLTLGAISESITVTADATPINTADASVGTVVERQFVENMPLNGRSFQDLILLTPGVVTNSPQSPGLAGYTGEFSVNGQRTESNYYTVDGVSANVGITPGAGGASGIAGSVAASTALGTTQALVSVDALEEFRVQSSSYSAEYGRSPGGEISFSTRSGTNQWHGTAFDYLRNNFFDANDWFTNYYSQPSPTLRQNDFGGTVGGPVDIPHLYKGTDKTFFFFSYEGLRLVQPQPATVTYAPDLALRQSAPAVLQPVLNAFPIPNGPDLGNGLAEYISSSSSRSSIDAYSIRLDHIVNDKLKLFFRFSDTPSNTPPAASGAYAPVSGFATALESRTYTIGAVSVLSNRLSNDFRLNYTANGGREFSGISEVGGSVPVDLAQLEGVNKSTNVYGAYFILQFPGYTQELGQTNVTGAQNQWNIIDTVSLSLGRHQLKFGGDFRRLTPSIVQGVPTSPLSALVFSDAAGVQSNSGIGEALAYAPAYPLYRNFSAFVQDGWRVAARLTLSMGLRWEVNPAPGATNGHIPYTVEGSSLSTLSLAPAGTPLWQTTWFNFAPRLGVAYILRNNQGSETVVRAGGGVFFDTGQQNGSGGFNDPSFLAVNVYAPAAFPLTQAQLNVPILNPPVAPYGTIYAYPKHLQLPYTWEWNGSVEQALGKSQSLTVSYVGSHGSRLPAENQIYVAPFNSNFSTVIFYQDSLTSDYDSLQVQFQRRLTGGLAVLGSYTWSHCLDYGSANADFAYKRGNCNFDVRHNFSSALSYDLPSAYKNRFMAALLGRWGFDDRFTAHTAFPVTLNGNYTLDSATGQFLYSGLDVVPGQPFYLHASQYPGGRAINPAAFALPPSGQLLGDAPRNFLRGFGAWQMNMAVRREFPINERLKLQFRAEAFNVFNHPNFGTVNADLGNVQFGQATATLANSSGVLNSLYQQGAARSMQFALKLLF